jgi:hypothetical protein
VLDGIPITTPQRTLVDLAPHIDDRDLARSLRELLRLGLAPASASVVPRFHRDEGADELRAAAWVRAGWSIARLSTDAVYDGPRT